jgi:hypothetical protein
MNNALYDIDYSKLTRWQAPAYIRKSRLLALLRIAINGVVFLYQDLLRFRKRKLYELMITPQVCYLERLLNDRFDFTQRRIRIIDPTFFEPVWLAQEEELAPVYFTTESENDPVWLPTEEEVGQIQNDFVITAPASINFDENEMRSLVNVFKLAGKRYKISRT